MRKYAILTVILLLTGCASGPSLSQFHTGCMDAYPDFSNQLACVKNNVANNPSLAASTLTQEYLMTGDVLLADMRAGKISEEQAQLEFLRKLNQVKSVALTQRAQQSVIRQEMDSRFPHYTNCYPVGRGMQCTTF
jgi:hypothetical protein